MPPVGKGSGLPPPDDLEATWRFLLDGIEVMMNKHTEGMDYPRYMKLYTVAYDYCTSSRMNSSGRTALGSGYNKSMGANLVGADLYERIKLYYRQHAEHLRKGATDLSEETLLRYYADEWTQYTQGANYVHRLFVYLNRHWVKREKDEGKKNVYTVYTLSLVQWRDHMFRQTQAKNRITDAVLKQIQNQRNGETIDTGLVKKVVDSFISLGLDENDSVQANTDLYKSEFETAFITATELYYRTESTAFVAANSVTDYMKKAETRLKEEEDRVEMYLHPGTRARLIKRCENALIAAHEQLLWDEFDRLLENDKEEDLYRMYTLLSRIPDGLEPLRRQFEEHVKRKGAAAVEKEAGTNVEAMEPAAYVAALLSVHSKFVGVINNAFRSEAGFLAALDKACRVFVNKNKATGDSTSKSPELLAKHTDGLLKKSNKSAEEASLEEDLNQVMIVFKYIEDKDVFQKFYSKMLAKRLVNFASASDDAEASMISKLKETCGFEYTNKLQRMFTDMGLSKELNDHFKEQMNKQFDKSELMDFYALVLANGFWPLNAPTSEFSIPTELLPMYTRFERYYAAKHSGRKLTWLWQLAKTDISTSYLSHKHIFTTSAYQAAVLLQYNGSDTLTWSELQASTKLNDIALKGACSGLVKSKVLTEKGSGEQATYSLNHAAKFKKLRMNLNIPMRSEARAEATDVLKTVDEDRRLLLQATVVRIMKARKTLKHAQLVQEVVAQVGSRFHPDVSQVKKAIESLIEKEYLERKEGEREVLQYLA